MLLAKPNQHVRNVGSVAYAGGRRIRSGHAQPGCVAMGCGPGRHLDPVQTRRTQARSHWFRAISRSDIHHYLTADRLGSCRSRIRLPVVPASIRRRTRSHHPNRGGPGCAIESDQEAATEPATSQATTDGVVKRVRTSCELRGRKLSGASKRQLCGFAVTGESAQRWAPSAAADAGALRVAVDPSCSEGLTFRVMVRAKARGEQPTQWSRSWRGTPGAVCRAPGAG